MEDFSIEDLFNSLQTAQEKKSLVHLSERNVVELVLKLQRLELLAQELLHTVNGREYLTFEHLKTEVRSVLEQNGGRVALVDLPASLNVDLVHCERAAKEVVQESKGDLVIAQQEILSVAYFDSLAAEVNDVLQEVGAISIGDLARQFGLGTDVISSSLASRLGTIIKGRVEAGSLYTDGYVSRIKAQLRGALRAALEPVAVSDVAIGAGGEGVVGSSIRLSMVRMMVDELMGEGSIKGVLRGGAMWTPAAYVAAQQESLAAFYSTNGYISYSQLSGIGIGAPREYLAGRFPEGLPLASVCVSPSLLQQMEAQLEEAINNEGWCDVLPFLPPALGGADAAGVLDKLNSQGHCVLALSCVLSNGILDQIKEKLLGVAREAADAAAKKRHAKGAQPGGAAAAQHMSAGGKSSSSSAAADVDDDEDDWSRGGKKGKKGKKKSAVPSKQSSKSASKAAATLSDDVSSMTSLDVEHISQHVITWYPDMEGAGDGGNLPTSLAEMLRPAAIREYEQCLQAVFTAGAETRKRRCSIAASQADQAFQRFQLYQHGAQALVLDEATQSALYRHLVRTVGSVVLQWLIRYMEVSTSDSSEPSDDSQWEAAAAHPLTPPQQSALIRWWPPDVSRAVQSLGDALGGAEPQEVSNCSRAAAESMGLQLRVLDKKGERQLLATHRAALMESLSQETSPSHALALVLPLLVMQVHNKGISIPGRAISGVLAALKDKVPEETFSLVEEYHQLVVEQLKTASQGNDANQDIQQQVQDKLPLLKAAVNVAIVASREAIRCP